MTSYVVDSWAWIECLEGTAKGARVRTVVEGNTGLFTLAVSLAEIVSKAKSVGKDPMAAAERVTSLSKFVSPTMADAAEAGLVHGETKGKVPNFSLADAFVLQTARRLGAKVLTGDPDFKHAKEAEVVG